MSGDIVTVFGGSGFIGRYIVRALCKRDFRVRVATRRPHVAQDLKVIGDVGQVQLVQANIRHRDSVFRALENANAAVNCVGLLFEAGRQNFDHIHAEGAELIARCAAEQGIERMVQISAIGADPQSESEYARTKAEGEEAVMAALPGATILRPSIVFGPEDGFFNRFASMARFAPALPLIGGGKTRFQPVYVVDVAEAVAAALMAPSAYGQTFELGGPNIYSFKQLMELMLEEIDRKRFLAPLPFPIATAMGKMGELLGAMPLVEPFLTADQVTLLKTDNVVSANAKTLAELNIQPTSVEAIIPTYLERYRKGGQFHERAESTGE